MRKSLAIGMTMIVLGLMVSGTQATSIDIDPETEAVRNRLVQACKNLGSDPDAIEREICDTILETAFCVVAAGLGIGDEYSRTSINHIAGYIRIEIGTESKLATPWSWLEGKYDDGMNGMCTDVE